MILFLFLFCFCFHVFFTVPGPPQNVIAEDTGSSFRVSWEPPERANGILLNYEVMYSIPSIDLVRMCLYITNKQKKYPLK